MLVKIALGNVRRSIRDYAIYFFTIAMGVAIFYAFNTISLQTSFLSESTAEALKLVSQLISGLTVFLAVILGFLMVYANNFLVRRRKEEFGLYQVLGMTRGQVSRIMCVETLVTGLAAFACGIALGVLISQFLVFVSAMLFNDTVQQFRFLFSWDALTMVAVCWIITFLVMLLFNLRTISKVRLVDLMGAGRMNESQRLRNLPVCAVLTVVSLALIVWAYVRLTVDGLPVDMEVDDSATIGFWITTAMVTVGTFGFFWGAPTVILALLSRVRGFFYRDLNMFTLRQVSSRINSNSFSMAVTAMVLFLALTSVTGGMSISAGLNKGLATAAPFDATIGAYYFPPQGQGEGTYEGKAIAVATGPVDLWALLGEKGLDTSGFDVRHVQVDVRQVPKGSGEGLTLSRMLSAAGTDGSGLYGVETTMPPAQVESLSDYNRTRELLGEEPVTLADDQYLLTANGGNTLVDKVFDPALAKGVSFTLAGTVLHPARTETLTGPTSALQDSSFGENMGTCVVPDALVAGLPMSTSIVEMEVPDHQVEAFEERFKTFWSQTRARGEVYEFGPGEKISGFLTNPMTYGDAVDSSFTMTGLVGYLAAYIGFILVVSCAAILAIQQLSSVADSVDRYRLLNELGAPVRMLDRSVLAQVLLCFLAPLVVALAHSVVALVQVVDVVSLLAPIDMAGSLQLPFIIFLVVFGGYLLITYLLSRSMVEGRIAAKSLR